MAAFKMIFKQKLVITRYNLKNGRKTTKLATIN